MFAVSPARTKHCKMDVLITSNVNNMRSAVSHTHTEEQDVADMLRGSESGRLMTL